MKNGNLGGDKCQLMEHERTPMMVRLCVCVSLFTISIPTGRSTGNNWVFTTNVQGFKGSQLIIISPYYGTPTRRNDLSNPTHKGI